MKTLSSIEKNVTFFDMSEKAVTLPTIQGTELLQKGFNTSRFKMLNSLQNVKDIKTSRTFNKKMDLGDTYSSFLTQCNKREKSEYMISKSQLSREQKDNVKSNLIVLKTLQVDKEINYFDKKHYEHANENSVKQLYFHYKNLDKIKQQNSVQKLDQSAFTAMLDKMKKYYPRKIGIVKTKGDPDIVQLKNRYLGDKYTEALAQGVQKLPDITQLLFANNKITDQGIINLVPSFGPHLIKIDLSGNMLGQKGCQILSGIFKINSQLVDFNLSHNLMGNQNMSIILSQINKTPNLKLKILDISKNNLSNEIVSKICEMITKNRQLKELYLDWNKIKAEGANYLFKLLIENETLKVLDISWNNLGNGQIKPCVKLLCDFLQDNKSIVHMDLSSNNFTHAECVLIAKSLNKFNKTIYGFHFSGNYGYIDNKGYLIIPNKERDVRENQLYQKIKGVEAINIKVNKERIDSLNHCWICDGWQEQIFEWTPMVSNPIDVEPVFIHLQFEHYRTRYMGNLQRTGKFQYKRMVPNQDFNNFFFTHNWQQTVQLDRPKKQVKSRTYNKIQILNEKLDISLKQMNYFEFEKQKPVIGTNYYPNFKILPRTPEFKCFKNKKEIKEKWVRKNSFFKNWIIESDEIFNQIFELDWEQSQISKIYIDQPVYSQMKNLFKNNYKQIKNVYKYYSCQNPVGDIWAIQFHEFTDFIKKIEITDGKASDADINLRYASTIHNNPKKNPRFPERGLIRFQMIEIIVRIAEEKYLKFVENKNILKALELLFTKNLNKELQNIYYDQQYWRENYLWNEKCNKAIEYYSIILENIFKIKSVDFIGEEDQNFIPIHYFIQILRDCGFMVDQLQECEINSAYCLSMMSQVDEINSERINQIRYPEFVEALCRCAFLMRLDPIGPQQDNLGYNKTEKQPLHIPMEALFQKLYILTEPKIKSQFKLPNKSIFFIQEDVYEPDE